MTTKEAFKDFVSSKPILAKYVNEGKMTWQKFYEMYDLYGDKSDVWNEYLEKEAMGSTTSTASKINDFIKGVDIDSIKQHIDTAQKALDFVQELTSKTTPEKVNKVITPRPLNKFFED